MKENLHIWNSHHSERSSSLLQKVFHAFSLEFPDHTYIVALSLYSSYINFQGIPGLKEPNKWPSELRNFTQLCLDIEPDTRQDSKTLLEHPFMKLAGHPSEMTTLIERSKQIKKENADLGDDDDDM